jgi:hypothetical protein
MKQFSKSVLAATLLVAAGAANASINNLNNTDSEAYLSVYDKSQDLTFTLDLGVSMSTLISKIADGSYQLHYDLSSNDMWNTFAANMDASKTVYGVAVGFNQRILITGANEIKKFTTIASASAVGIAVKNRAGEINGGQLADNPGQTVSNYAANLSSLVYGADTPKTGQHNNFNSIFGVVSAANANIAYGEWGDFWYYNGIAAHTLAANKWQLSGNELKFSAVPVPAAVWMFGTGLMAMFGLNRRKAAKA